MTLFPDRFSCQSWQGTRAKQFAKPEDAFQQLVGDALLGQFSAMVHVASTAGRDGSIDAWVEANALASGQFSGFCFPLLVECKHHDDNSPNTAKKIRKGWNAVKEKLSRHAANDWPGLYAPWKQARAYLYWPLDCSTRMPMSAACAPARTAVYRRRRPEHTVLYRTVQTHLATWLELSCDSRQGASGPAHVVNDPGSNGAALQGRSRDGRYSKPN